MVTETPTPPAETPSEAEAKPRATTPASVVVWVIYLVGILATTVLVASVGFVAVAYALSRDGDFGVDVALPALVVWIVLIGLALGTFAVRRWGGPR
jgi:hypothetical protein